MTGPKPILVDDPGHPDDLTAAVSAILEQVGFPMPAPDLRDWLAREFFAWHLPRYSKSHRKAPIYWPLATPSARYTLWLYYPALTRDTFYRVLHDHLTPKIQHEERQLADLTQRAGDSPTSSQRKDLAALDTFVTELRAFREEVTRIAPLWNPNLNDGVILNFAPLWRLVPQHKPWQKECRACWNKLAAGDYDWAHGAMHLWPARVVAKCAEDRSLAIAHDLEPVFWATENGVWRNRGDLAHEEQCLRAQLGTDSARSLLEWLWEVFAVGPDNEDRQVAWERLAHGLCDDTLPAVLLWPERVGRQCAESALFTARIVDSLRQVLQPETHVPETILQPHHLKQLTKIANSDPYRTLPMTTIPAVAGKILEWAKSAGSQFRVHLPAIAQFFTEKPPTTPWIAYWDDLWKGRLAHLWLCLTIAPDFVIPQCLESVEHSQSLGIADRFWIRDPHGQWHSRLSPDQEIHRHAAWRTSLAVQEALRSLLDSPAEPPATPSRKKTAQSAANPAEPRPRRGRPKTTVQVRLAFDGPEA